MRKAKLFCLPYAGGAAASFRQWKAFFCPDIEVRAVELAGRGTRMREPNYRSLDDAVDDVLNIVEDELYQGPYALFGHGLGSLIAFELAHKIRRENLPGPIHLVFSGRAAPQVARDKKRDIHHLPDEEFKNALQDMGGVSRDFFEHQELLSLFLPVLRNDFRLTETYVYIEKDSPLDCDITVLSGEYDDCTKEEVEAWRSQTRGRCDIHYLSGGHFFIHDYREDVFKIIGDAVHRSWKKAVSDADG
jgi:medium-chain acyl-[acyl-carrier-protein] hydrolase